MDTTKDEMDATKDEMNLMGRNKIWELLELHPNVSLLGTNGFSR